MLLKIEFYFLGWLPMLVLHKHNFFSCPSFAQGIVIFKLHTRKKKTRKPKFPTGNKTLIISLKKQEIFLHICSSTLLIIINFFKQHVQIVV
jgi:hypothetical protein